MAKDFFEELGEAITKTAREIGGRAEVLYGTQKLKNKISGEERQIQKIMEELEKFFTEDIGKACRWMICRGVSASRLIRG